MIFDTIVLGAGPAGLSAAVYGTRFNLNLLVIGKEGGTMAEADEICNYLGFPSIPGAEMDKMFNEHAKKLGVKIIREEITEIKKEKEFFVVKAEKDEYKSKTLIYALGGRKRELGLPEEKKFRGRGVSYCATCDAPFFKNKTVAVAGGRNSAAVAALLLSKFAKKVYIVYRGNELKAFPSFVKKIEETENIETIFNSAIKEIMGGKLIEKVFLENLKTGETSEMAVSGVFVQFGSLFGSLPNSELAKKLGVETTEEGRIIVREDTSTNVKGFFAAGDVTDGRNKFDQVITAAAEGAIAAQSVYKLISEVD